jgi:hypothetical protein
MCQRSAICRTNHIGKPQTWRRLYQFDMTRDVPTLNQCSVVGIVGVHQVVFVAFLQDEQSYRLPVVTCCAERLD